MTDTRTPGPAPMFSSNTGDWYTPPEIVEAVRDLFDGRIDLDPCSNSHEAPNVPALVHFTREDDGLSREWFGRVYLNPPYGKGIGPWIEKVREEYEAGRVTAAVVLVKAATDTRWFRVLSERYPRCEVAGRLRFSGCKNPAPFPSVLFYLGDDVQRFADVFGRFGVLVAPLPAARKAGGVGAGPARTSTSPGPTRPGTGNRPRTKSGPGAATAAGPGRWDGRHSLRTLTQPGLSTCAPAWSMTIGSPATWQSSPCSGPDETRC